MARHAAVLILATLLCLPGLALAQRRDSDLKEGDLAPDFTLYDLTGRNPVRLSQFRGKSPVVLVFGSYT